MIWVLQELYCELKKFFWSDLRQHIVGRRTRGYLLYGPQGSGKKFLAECIAGVSWSFALLIQAVTGNSIMRHVVCSWNSIIRHAVCSWNSLILLAMLQAPKTGELHILDMYSFWMHTQHNTTHTHTHIQNNSSSTTNNKNSEAEYPQILWSNTGHIDGNGIKIIYT